MNDSSRPRVSVVIKALNEERRIVAAIESALAAVQPLGGEVILADSASTDRTVALAAAYPVRIVQLANPGERCCGVGPQLGYQHSRGEFIYILDGDMKLHPGFLEQALDFMAANPDVAGVGGQVLEQNRDSLEYLGRIERAAHAMPVGESVRLDMGGLYRRAAIEQVGYFSNRNLHSYEEFDLAMRLRARGWRLWRLGVPAVDHHGHDVPAYELLMRRWRSAYICGVGEVVRAAIGQPHQRLVLTALRELWIYVAALLWLLALPLVAFGPGPVMVRASGELMLALLPWLAMALKKRSASKAAYSVVSWIAHVGGLLRGLLRRQVAPDARIASVDLTPSPGALRP